MSASAVLAIWADCKPGFESLFEQWYQHEHLPERLAVPGFRRGRRYEAVDDAPRFLTCYHAESTATFRSPAYLARLDDPTPLTRKIMSEAVANLSRTICRCEGHGAMMTGAFALTIPLDDEASTRSQTVDIVKARLAELLPVHPGLTRYEVWLAESESTEDPAKPLSAEQALRGRDQSMAGCVFIETLRQTDALDIRQTLNDTLKTPKQSARSIACFAMRRPVLPIDRLQADSIDRQRKADARAID